MNDVPWIDWYQSLAKPSWKPAPRTIGLFWQILYPAIIATFASWGVALAEYLLQVPANRIGYTTMNLGQLKILHEAIALSVFVPFAVLYMKHSLRLNYLWAALCICGAVYFMFRES